MHNEREILFISSLAIRKEYGVFHTWQEPSGLLGKELTVNTKVGRSLNDTRKCDLDNL